MFFTNLTREVGIGANSYLLEADGCRILLDAGMHPRAVGEAATPDFSPLETGCDAIILSHAHQDHVGCLPLAMRRFPDAPVFMTEATAAIAEVMLHNSVNVMTRQREELDLTAYPLFTHREIDRAAGLWQARPLRMRFGTDGDRAGGGAPGRPDIEFYDAGHILGSVGVMIRSEGRRFFYTGDVNFEDQTLMRAARFPEESVDVLVMETTRGDSPTPEGMTRTTEEDRLAAALGEAMAAGAPVLIPVFALGKTQEILALLYRWRKTGVLRRGFGLIIGGLGSKITGVFDKVRGSAPRQMPDLKLSECLPLSVVGGRDLASLSVQPRTIYAISSGMMTENTLSNVLAPRFLENPDARIFFVGYADPESPAGKVRVAQPDQQILLDPRLPAVKRRCHVENFTLSAHATRESLLGYVRRLRPGKVLLVHGDPPAAEWFRREIPAVAPGTDVLVPQPGVRCEV